ncbi:nose resistant to fluoxetine protein 6-like [Arctopsyche grandis]|uniref:nose resistant to fluoxetine protein 6-like n=1 Tax=Arctopsyche grandis TaxID=121162 RepID=UPI00406D7DBE
MATLNTLMLLALTVLSVVATYDGPSTNIDDHLMRNSIFYGLVATASMENSTSLCSKHLIEIADGIVNRNRWAMKLIDASGMPSGGLHWGAIYWLGSKTQCEATRVLHDFSASPSLGPVTKETTEDLPPFPIAYFAAYFQHDSDIQIITHVVDEFRMVLGLCLPMSCDGPELTTLLQKYFNSKILAHQNLYNTSYQMEFVRKLVDDYSWLRDYKTITFLSMIAVTLMMCAVGTVYDVKFYQPMIKSRKSANMSYKNGIEIAENIVNGDTTDPKTMTDEFTIENHKPIDFGLGCRILRCFSMYSNNKIICNTNVSSGSHEIIHGLRFLSTIVVILSHSVLAVIPAYDNGALTVLKPNFIGLFSLGLVNYTVDTFFCIRITPSYMISFAMSVFVFTWRPKIAPILNTNYEICPKYWWRNLLYINSFFPRTEMCLGYTWYLSDDMQFFVVVSFCLILSTM